MDNNADKEEFERFEQALRPCRVCGHLRIAHSFLKPNKGRCVDANVKVTGEYKGCKCKRYTPKDNLEFLEWVAANKLKEKK